MPKLSNDLKESFKKALNPKPLWEGPYSTGKNGGLTYSLFSRFLVCRHRFWIKTVKGLKQDEGFDYKMEYGNAWHYCEELLAANKSMEAIMTGLATYCKKLSGSHGLSGNDIMKIYNCCKVQFPLYVEYWKKQKDVKDRKPVYQEQVFNVPYQLPDRRVVVLRGKWDSVDIIKNEKRVVGYYAQENKSKSDIKLEELKRDLPNDLQSMLYVIALMEHFKGEKTPIHGVRYNVIRRPLSGQKYNIRRREGRGKDKSGAESDEEFYKRLGEVIREASFDSKNNPLEHSDFFVRFKVDVTREDVERFKKMVFNPLLTQLCDWWDSIQSNPFDPWNKIYEEVDVGLYRVGPNPHHWMFPSGVYNPALEGRASMVDELIATGNERGFVRPDTLFPELVQNG